MASKESIAALTQAVQHIEEAAAKLREYLNNQVDDTAKDSSGLCSKGLAGSLSIPFNAPPSVGNAKNVLLEATTSLQHLLMSPSDLHRQLATSTQHAACVRWLCYFKIPDLVPESPSGIEFSQLANAAKVPESYLARICMMAATAGFFHCPSSTRVTHSPISLGFRSPSPLRDTMLFLTETAIPMSHKLVEMIQSKSDSSPASFKTAFQIANDTELDFFPYLSKHPEIMQRLAAGMKDYSAARESHVQHLADGFDWGALGTARVVDIGGSYGHASIAIAESFPSISCTVQDLPPVIAGAQKQQLGSSVAGRISFQAHNFLTPQPASSSDADVFVIRQCIQNHPHENAVKIVRNVVPCLERPHSRLILNHVVLPSPGGTNIGKREEAGVRSRDLLMMEAMDGQERDIEQWRQLLKEADERLEIINVTKPEGSVLSIIEVALRKEN